MTSVAASAELLTPSPVNVLRILREGFRTLFHTARIVVPLVLFSWAIAFSTNFQYYIVIPDYLSFYVLIPLYNILYVLFIGAVIIAVFEYLEGRKISLGWCFRQLRGRALPYLGLIIMIGFAELAGFLFIVIFAIILAARWYVAVPCLLGEGLGPRKSLARSAMLTQGSRVRVLTLAFIIGLPWFLVSVVLVELSESYGSLLFSGIILLLDHIIGAYAAVTMTLLHRDLRRRREGPGRDELTAIFA